MALFICHWDAHFLSTICYIFILPKTALTKGMLGINGNLNAKQIKDICDRHRIRYQVTDDRQVLEKVKKKRNSLAHGDESFSHCARDLTLTDLETIKDTVIQFIQEILTGMEKYCDEKQFLRHA